MTIGLSHFPLNALSTDGFGAIADGPLRFKIKVSSSNLQKVVALLVELNVERSPLSGYLSSARNNRYS